MIKQFFQIDHFIPKRFGNVVDVQFSICTLGLHAFLVIVKFWRQLLCKVAIARNWHLDSKISEFRYQYTTVHEIIIHSKYSFSY